MARNITVTLKDGSQIRYDGVPDTVTPAEVQSRAEKESGLAVVEIDGGSPTKEAPAPAPKGAACRTGTRRCAGWWSREG